jgi:hypothetical protein
MPVVDSYHSTLANIIVKVRRLTRTPSSLQLTDQDIANYVDTFVLYDFPETLRLFNLHENFTFYITTNVDEYDTNVVTAPTDPLYNFKNNFIATNKPIYIAGYQAFYSQSQEQFYNIYPKLNYIVQIGLGDGLNTAFAGTLQSPPVLKNNVTFTSTDINGNGLIAADNGIGFLTDTDTGAVVGTINYITGAYLIAFPTAPGNGVAVNSQTVPYVAARPVSMLYFDGKFNCRPVPDQPYRVDWEVMRRPSSFLNAAGNANMTQMPELAEWWQYIAYGAAKKVFEDRLDTDSIQLIMPELKNQEDLIQRRTLVQLANQRTATIYTEATGLNITGYGWGPW